ncbi:hypothetical protein ADEAN_000646900 [Angomonas deanei]|uniref:Uncharacterized protein n=1 Tax=Angomonas deanei TaxID=59799 RepID=A0A7G2CGV0_9TRYP|nr:hypothetical protein ADEAN_000646900 [Angomonas deanei]
MSTRYVEVSLSPNDGARQSSVHGNTPNRDSYYFARSPLETSRHRRSETRSSDGEEYRNDIEASLLQLELDRLVSTMQQSKAALTGTSPLREETEARVVPPKPSLVKMDYTGRLTSGGEGKRKNKIASLLSKDWSSLYPTFDADTEETRVEPPLTSSDRHTEVLSNPPRTSAPEPSQVSFRLKTLYDTSHKGPNTSLTSDTSRQRAVWCSACCVRFEIKASQAVRIDHCPSCGAFLDGV